MQEKESVREREGMQERESIRESVQERERMCKREGVCERERERESVCARESARSQERERRRAFGLIQYRNTLCFLCVMLCLCLLATRTQFMLNILLCFVPTVCVMT